MNKIIYLLSIAVLFIISSCRSGNDEAAVNKILTGINNKFIPDARTGIFNYGLGIGKNGLEITGETNYKDIISAINDSILSKKIIAENKIILLPEISLKGKVHGIINVSVSNIRSRPQHTSEMVTQAILGTPVNVYKEMEGWYLIQTPDKYLGWIDNGAIQLLDKSGMELYLSSKKIIVTKISGFSYAATSDDAVPVSDIVAGSVLPYENETDDYYYVKYPDSRNAFIKKSEASLLETWLKETTLNPSSLVETSFKLNGLPYLWGGTSTKGVDCSGFTKTVYFMHGLILPRDASQQNDIGIIIDEQKDFLSLEPGDLLFFGRKTSADSPEKIIHVGMWVGNMQYLHASGNVHLSSMDPSSELFDEYNYNRYIRSRRMIGFTTDSPNVGSVYQP